MSSSAIRGAEVQEAMACLPLPRRPPTSCARLDRGPLLHPRRDKLPGGAVSATGEGDDRIEGRAMSWPFSRRPRGELLLPRPTAAASSPRQPARSPRRAGQAGDEPPARARLAVVRRSLQRGLCRGDRRQPQAVAYPLPSCPTGRGGGVQLQRYRDGGLSDATTSARRSLSWRWAAKRPHPHRDMNVGAPRAARRGECRR